MAAFPVGRTRAHRPLMIRNFDGGVAIVGSADTRGINELLVADSMDLGPRGSLVAGSDVTPYTTVLDSVGAPFGRIFEIADASSLNLSDVAVIGVGGGDNLGTPSYIYAMLDRATATATTPFTSRISPFDPAGIGNPAPTPLPEGAIVTSAGFTGNFQIRPAAEGVPPANPAINVLVLLVNIGARRRDSPGPRAWAVCAPGLGFVCGRRELPDRIL